MGRGRPREFDEDEALREALQVFWTKGLSATSLDDLADAMGMRRPSIYNAFGSKEALYRLTLARFCGQLDQGLRDTMDNAETLAGGLTAFYDRAIEVYCGNDPQLGCLVVCTAPSAALSHPEVGADLRALIRRLDDGLTRRLKERHAELSPGVAPRQAAKLLQATLQTLALRARCGEPQTSLRELARYAVAALT